MKVKMKFKLRYKTKGVDEVVSIGYETTTPEAEKIHWGRYGKVLEDRGVLDFMECKIEK